MADQTPFEIVTEYDLEATMRDGTILRGDTDDPSNTELICIRPGATYFRALVSLRRRPRRRIVF